MEVNEFYGLVPEYTTTDLVPFFAFEVSSFVFPELGFTAAPNPNSLENFRTQTRVQIKVIKSRYMRRGMRTETKIWAIASIWFDGEPIAVIRNIPVNDNDGSYYPNRFITEPDVFNTMIKFLFSLIQREETYSEDNWVLKHFNEMYSGGVQFQPLVFQPTDSKLELLPIAIDEILL